MKLTIASKIKVSILAFASAFLMSSCSPNIPIETSEEVFNSELDKDFSESGDLNLMQCRRGSTNECRQLRYEMKKEIRKAKVKYKIAIHKLRKMKNKQERKAKRQELRADWKVLRKQLKSDIKDAVAACKEGG